MHKRAALFFAALVAVALLVVPTSAPTSPSPAQAPAAVVAAGVTLTGLDAHDGTVVKDGATYYLYGTRYACGFQWGVTTTPFCGFGVWTGPGLAGPWTFVRNLFDPAAMNSWLGQTWTATCAANGSGCFNPRMVQRASDGVWILWFNAPGDYWRSRANAYYNMGCAGPAGPCGEGVTPNGSMHKPSMSTCYDNGDFSIFSDAATGIAYIACTMADQTLRIEQLDVWWTNGVGTGVTSLAGITNAESPGVWRNSDGYWLMTYSDPNCGYCAGDGTSYAYSGSPIQPWKTPTNSGFSADPKGRRLVSGNSCGGQPRTVFTVDSQPYQWIDLWQGTTNPRNQTAAGIRIEPLTVTGPYTHPADGTPWTGAIAQFQCG